MRLRTDSERDSLAANAGYQVAGNLLSLALRLVYMVALARLLGAADYGLYVYALSWYLLFLPLTSLGQDLDLARSLGVQSPAAAGIVAATLTLRVYVGLVLIVLVATLTYFTAASDDEAVLVLLFSFTMVPRSVALWCQRVFIAAEQSRYLLREDLRYRTLEVVAGIGVLQFGGDLSLLALVHAGSWILQAASGVMLVRRRVITFDFALRVPRWRALGRDGFKVSVSRSLEGWFFNGPLILLRHWSTDLDALGRLAFCVQVLNLLRLVPKSVGSAALPVVARTQLRGGRAPERLLKAIALFAALQGLLLGWFSVLIGTPLIAFLLGPSFGPANAHLPFVAWMSILPIAGVGAHRVLGVAGDLNRLVVPSLAGALVMSALAWVWIPPFGVQGVLFATLVGSLVWILAVARGLGAAAPTLVGLSVGGAIAAALVSLGPFLDAPNTQTILLFQGLATVSFLVAVLGSGRQ